MSEGVVTLSEHDIRATRAHHDQEEAMRTYLSTEATRRPAASLSLRAAQMPAVGGSLRLDGAIEGTSVEFCNHQWKPNKAMEPPV